MKKKKNNNKVFLSLEWVHKSGTEKKKIGREYIKRGSFFSPPFYLSLKSLSFLLPGNWLHTLRHPQHRSKKPFFLLIFLLKPAQKTQNPHPFFWGGCCVLLGWFSSVGRRRSRSNNSSRVVETHSTEQKHKSDYVHYKEQTPPTNPKIGHRERNPWNTHQGHEHTRHTHTHPTSTAGNNANE